MGLIQETKAEKALDALAKLASPIAKVKRDGKIKEIPCEDVVPGDIVLLENGNYVPADCRIIESARLGIDESALTGENIASNKDANAILNNNVLPADMLNMAFATTTITSGHGEAVVCDIGMRTKVGQIANLIMSNESPETPLQRKLGEVGKKLGLIAIAICGLIFLIGILKHIPWMEMFMTSIGLAVAAIPEGLPAVVTILLSIGVTKMAKKNSIIRKLPAVETLGSSQVICSDKTGTLTQNKMKVVQITDGTGTIDKPLTATNKLILELGSLCSDSYLQEENGKLITIGEPTENAIVNASIENNIYKSNLEKEFKRVGEIPFDSNRKLMTTIHKVPTGYKIITKGAPDVLLGKCTMDYNKGIIRELSESRKAQIQKINTQMAERALRVLGVAYIDIKIMPQKLAPEIVEKNLIFVGLIGMIDPPREGVKEAVQTCTRAGIKTVMITGDHLYTAKAIAKEIGILKSTDKAITGAELDKLPQDKFEKEIMDYSVFARVSPEHKVRIVKAYRANGKITAMTGDGVNDAPALKIADIGVAMGKGGTDVAKNAADMILADDNFVTIAGAVKTGRHIFDNIKKAIHFLLATNVGEIVVVFLGLLFGLESPLLAIQLLWVNLVTDSLPAIALGMEPAEEDIMNRKPESIKKGLFAGGMWSKIFVEGTMIGLLTLIAFTIGNKFYSVEVGRSMAFVALSMLELVHSFNIKSEESIFKVGITKNPYLIGSFILGAVLQIGVVSIPYIAQIFKCTPLNIEQWLITLGISICPIFIMEIQKKLNEIKFGKRVYSYQK